jgi:monofunctional biosynthetic peptidoglycan transglycosylase
MKNLILNIILLISISMHSQSIDLLNPEKNIGLDNWNIVNDDVMGGISTSYLSVSDEKNLIFNGNLSLENNGGFASSRLGLKKNILKGVKSLTIRIKGDGNSYKLRLSQDNRRASYSANFESVKNEWVEVNIPIEDFIATWRGYTYTDYPSIQTDRIISLGLQISDKQEGKFKLEIDYIKAIL